MAKAGIKVNVKELIAFKKRLENADINGLMEKGIKELAKRTLAAAIPKTPVGLYPAGSGKVGGTLKRGFGNGVDISSNIAGYVETLTIGVIGGYYKLTIKNYVIYASYVEYGHWTVNRKRWVAGRFYLTLAIYEVNMKKKAILQKLQDDFLRECFR